MDPTRVAEAASLLVAARQQQSRIGPLPTQCRPQIVADAHAIQDAITARLGAEVGAFKANAPAGGEPVRAPIYAPAIRRSPARISQAEMGQGGVEGEVAFRFRRDLPSRPTPYTREEIAACVDACAAIEIVSSRFADPDTPMLDKLADSISNQGFVSGELTADWQSLDLATLRVVLEVNGEAVLEQSGGHPTNDPLGVAVALVELLRPAGGVKAGQFVTCGSYTGLRYLKPGEVCCVRFDGLGSAEVSFAA
ncbi:MAG: hypothetical protein JO264_10645 [Acidisphaera sp.]|nr:hypothetical protein [Acidisphaera sp.]